LAAAYAAAYAYWLIICCWYVAEVFVAPAVVGANFLLAVTT
jgi:hypothetical protein